MPRTKGGGQEGTTKKKKKNKKKRGVGLTVSGCLRKRIRRDREKKRYDQDGEKTGKTGTSLARGKEEEWTNREETRRKPKGGGGGASHDRPRKGKKEKT